MTKRKKACTNKFRTTPTPCLNCREKLDGASAVQRTRKGPKPGDITICAYCGHLMAFDDDMSFRPLTDAEMIDMAGDKTMIAYQDACAAAFRRTKV